MKLENFPFSIGDELTIDHSIANDSGRIIFVPGEKVTIEDISTFGIEEEIIGIKLEERTGTWAFTAFKETKDFT
jgi:hypothetical protein